MGNLKLTQLVISGWLINKCNNKHRVSILSFTYQLVTDTEITAIITANRTAEIRRPSQ